MFANTNKNKGGTNVLTNAANTVVNAANNTLKNIGQGLNSGAQAVTNAVQNVGEGLNQGVNAMASGANAVTNVVANGANAVTNAVTNGANAITNAVQNVPAAINSIIPFTNNTGAAPAANNRRANNNKGANLPSNNTGAAPQNNLGQQLANFFKPANQGNAGANKNANLNINAGVEEVAANTGSFLSSGLGIFIILFAVLLAVFAYFEKEIRQGYEYVAVKIKSALGYPTEPDVLSQITPSQGQIKEVTIPPTPSPSTPDASMVEKILPTFGGNEVFNVAQNKFIYYDAEPLCKALGAELATYDQVKDAWSKGADWCNYGWVKGQMAIYPTQKDTYDKLQNGPPEEKNACGTVGINGGVFDNPEMRFGVNCYGKKPVQSAHDEKMLMEEGRLPYSADTLKVDRAVAEFKAQADSLFIKPFNEDKWSSS